MATPATTMRVKISFFMLQPKYSVPNKRGATFINFRNFVQGVRSYLGVVKYLLRGYVYSFWPKMSWGYDY